MKPLALAAALLGAGGLAGCGYVSFERPKTPDELRLIQSVHDYYGELGQAFAAGNADTLAELYSPSLSHPMTRAQLRAWAEKFFAEHGRARLVIKRLDVDELGYVQAVATVDYAVETPDGRGDFSGVERDVLERKKGRWAIASWDKE